MPHRIVKYEEAFNLINIELTDKIRKWLARFEEEGHSEKSICFAIWKSQTKLMAFKGDNRFWGIFKNEINKWSWKKGDPRWQDYWKRRNEAEKAEKIHQELYLSMDKKKSDGFIYFIQGECGGAIKIGYAKNVSTRLKGLQTGYPDMLKILKVISGNQAKEDLIHDELSGYRLNGEWFKPDMFVIKKIKQYE